MFADAIATRLQRFNISACREDDDAIQFFVPTPGNFHRSTPANELQRWHEEGAIRELLGLVNSIPELKRAVAAKLSDREPMAE